MKKNVNPKNLFVTEANKGKALIKLDNEVHETRKQLSRAKGTAGSLFPISDIFSIVLRT
jgi:hypothetical protein